VAWGLETSVEAMLASMDTPSELSRDQVEAICRRVRAPLLLVYGGDDRCQPLARAQRLAELTGALLVVLEDAGHLPTARLPIAQRASISGAITT
jgi:pimeloyl-ACP methyl ester carboxylesterase